MRLVGENAGAGGAAEKSAPLLYAETFCIPASRYDLSEAWLVKLASCRSAARLDAGRLNCSRRVSRRTPGAIASVRLLRNPISHSPAKSKPRRPASFEVEVR